jgi:hypothetical protein
MSDELMTVNKFIPFLDDSVDRELIRGRLREWPRRLHDSEHAARAYSVRRDDSIRQGWLFFDETKRGRKASLKSIEDRLGIVQRGESQLQTSDCFDRSFLDHRRAELFQREVVIATSDGLDSHGQQTLQNRLGDRETRCDGNSIRPGSIELHVGANDNCRPQKMGQPRPAVPDDVDIEIVRLANRIFQDQRLTSIAGRS